MEKGLKKLNIDRRVSQAEIFQFLKEHYMENGVLKICISQENTLFFSKGKYIST